MFAHRFDRTALFKIAATLGFGSLLAAATSTTAKAKFNTGVLALDGAWITTISGWDPAPFRLTAVYGGGIMVASGTGDEKPPQAPAYGAWRRTGDTTFHSHWATWTFGSDGTCNGIIHFYEDITLIDADHFRASCTWKQLDLHERVVGSGKAQEHAERLVA